MQGSCNHPRRWGTRPARYLGALKLADGLTGDGFFDGLVLGHGVAGDSGDDEEHLRAFEDVESGGLLAIHEEGVVADSGDRRRVAGGLDLRFERGVGGAVAERDVEVAVAFYGVPDAVFRTGSAVVDGYSHGCRNLSGGEEGAGVGCVSADGDGSGEENACGSECEGTRHGLAPMRGFGCAGVAWAERKR